MRWDDDKIDAAKEKKCREIIDEYIKIHGLSWCRRGKLEDVFEKNSNKHFRALTNKVLREGLEFESQPTKNLANQFEDCAGGNLMLKVFEIIQETFHENSKFSISYLVFFILKMNLNYRNPRRL